jgi:hypothetical protein
MLRWVRKLVPGDAEHRANGLAAVIALSAVSLLYLEAPPVPAGTDSIRIASHRSPTLRKAASNSQVLANVVEQVSAASTTPLSPTQQTEHAVRRKLEMLELGRKFLESVPDYTAQFSKQELVGGELLDEQIIQFKCRHQPFSLYLKWLSGDVGREVLYVDGQHDGDMIVHAGGWKARLPSLSISPNSPLALGESRYPVTNAGLLPLIKTIVAAHAHDATRDSIQRCEQLPDEEFDSRQCAVFVVMYKNSQVSPVYRKSIVLIDKEWNVPLYTRNFGWPDANAAQTETELDDATLIEFYTYTDVQFRQQLAEVEFDRTNEEYRFR